RRRPRAPLFPGLCRKLKPSPGRARAGDCAPAEHDIPHAGSGGASPGAFYALAVPATSVPAPDLAACAGRRARISERLGDAALLLAAGEPCTRSRDTHYRFRPESNFYYLAGLAEPSSVLLLRPGREPSSVLFV